MLHLGTMGWSYEHWIGNFFPAGTKPAMFLQKYSEHFDTVELDNTFYHIPSSSMVRRWREETPESFLFSAKFPRSITHEAFSAATAEKREIFLRNISLLGSKLGPLLLQFPSSFGPENTGVLRDFLSELPGRFRFALEVRDKEWLRESFYSLLRDKGIALALVEGPWMPVVEEVTSSFVYIRWEGDRRKVQGTLGRVEIDQIDVIGEWVQRIRGYLDDSLEIIGYFSKFFSGHPPTDIQQLKDLLGRKPIKKEARGTA
jgi:uncharacterized protein YecE (DUF72 family)